MFSTMPMLRNLIVCAEFCPEKAKMLHSTYEPAGPSNFPEGQHFQNFKESASHHCNLINIRSECQGGGGYSISLLKLIGNPNFTNS